MKYQTNKKSTKVCSLWGKRIFGKSDSHKRETFQKSEMLDTEFPNKIQQG